VIPTKQTIGLPIRTRIPLPDQILMSARSGAQQHLSARPTHVIEFACYQHEGATMPALRCATALLVWSVVSMPALAQMAAPAQNDQVFLIRQDSSDCTNSDVTAKDPSLIGGTATVARNPDGNTSVKVAITAKPNTTYRFSLKCGAQLGEIKTEDEGQGVATFNFPTSSTGATYAFEMFSEGAPADGKYQSVKVNFQ
jgi:hypothetical protein